MLEYLLQIIPTIADGLKVSIALFCVVWVLSIPGGIILALLRLSKLPVVDKIVEAFVYLMRGTPLMLYEGAKVLGFTYGQTMRTIILPQMFKRVLPPLANETINLLKDTSLVYVLAMNDILRITKSIVQRDFDISAFLVAAIFYLIFTFILTNIFNYLEKRFSVYDE